MLVTVVPGAGRTARTLEIPYWLLAVAVLSLAPLGLGAGFAGWHLQGLLGLSGLRVQPQEQVHQERWAVFEFAAKTSQTRTVAQMRRKAALARALRLGLGSRSTASALLRGHVEPDWLAEAEAQEKGPGTLLWPVRNGWFVRGYGSGEDGYHLAVDIMGDRGTDVLAAAPGIVGYSGNAVRGYGNLIMIVHPGGFVTAYAHNDVNHVVAGERVRAGQLIAALGNTGISRGPHVHFEFMHAGKNCDPLPLFRPGVRHRPGHLSDIPHAEWLGGTPPREIACGRRRRHPHSRYVGGEGELATNSHN